MTYLKDKLRKCEPVAGTHVFLKDPCITELLASLGYDFIWIDTEHTAIDYAVLETHLIAGTAGGTSTLVRVPWNDPIFVKRILEMGPTGIIFPAINTAQELQKAMESTLYPPYGIRGFGPMRALRYGIDDVSKFIENSNKNLVRCIQIESKTAVNNLEEMVKNRYVDCFMFGPCDLSGSIGELGNPLGKNTSDLIDKAVAILKSSGKSFGVSGADWNPEIIQYWHDKGMIVLSMGIDYFHLLKGAKDELENIRRIQGSK